MAHASSAPLVALELNEGISLLESAAATGFVTKPNGQRVDLGYDANGNLREGGVFDAEGRVPLHIIRPGIGKGRGRHLYEARMLQENSHKFSGWKMYLDHLSPEARKAAGGLPRGVRDLGGRVQETWWDPTVPADPVRGHEQGGVMGMVRPVKFIRELIDDDPQLVEASISATATGVQPVIRDNARAWLVEGIADRGSVDWVTEGGAGGRVASALFEAYASPEDVEMALVESLDEESYREYLRAHRPGDAPTPEGGAVSEIKPEAVQEALAASPHILVEAFKASSEFQTFVDALVEARLEDQEELMEAAAQDRVDRAFQLAALEREAHKIVNESKLPDSWKDGLFTEFSLTENRPAPALEVDDDVDDNGNVTKTARAKLTEAVTARVDAERTRLREASHTRVRGAGGSSELAEGADGTAETKKATPYWAELLSEAGVSDPEKLYADQA